MPIYWSMLVITCLCGVISYVTNKKEDVLESHTVYRTRSGFAIFNIAYIVFFISLRDKVMDTHSYIGAFQNTPNEWSEMIQMVSESRDGKLFYLLQGVFKVFISEDYRLWLTFLCVVSCMFLFRTLYKYSVDFPLTMYLFITHTTFTWLLNGTRQFLVVCILFGFVDWLIEGKKIQYSILIIILSFVHLSVIFILPVIFFASSQKILDRKILMFAILTIIGIRYSELVFHLLDVMLESAYTESLLKGDGSSIIRVVVSAIPVAIVLVSKNYVQKQASPSIILAINMSFIGICFFVAATFTNGILVGRMPIYFTVYNLYLLPWLIKECFNRESKKIAWISCAALYFIYFYYQMVIAWGGLRYVSETLNINF